MLFRSFERKGSVLIRILEEVFLGKELNGFEQDRKWMLYLDALGAPAQRYQKIFLELKKLWWDIIGGIRDSCCADVPTGAKDREFLSRQIHLRAMADRPRPVHFVSLSDDRAGFLLVGVNGHGF